MVLVQTPGWNRTEVNSIVKQACMRLVTTAKMPHIDSYTYRLPREKSCSSRARVKKGMNVVGVVVRF